MTQELQLAHALHDRGDLTLALEALALALKAEPTMANWLLLTQWLEEAEVLDAARLAFAAVDEHGDHQGPVSHRLDSKRVSAATPRSAIDPYADISSSSQPNASKATSNETKPSWRTRIRSHSVLMRRSHSYSKHQCGFWCLWVQKWLGRCSRRCTECGLGATSSGGRCHSNRTQGTATQGGSSNEDPDRSSAENRRPFSLFESEGSMAILEADTRDDSEQDEQQLQMSDKTTTLLAAADGTER